MMDLEDIVGNAIDQDKGRWLAVMNPWTAEPTGIRMLIAGPDSESQRKAQIAFHDDLVAMALPDGSISTEARQAVRQNMLARLVLGWEIVERGQPVPFSHVNVVRVLRSAKWIEEQVDGFAGDRAKFGPGSE